MPNYLVSCARQIVMLPIIYKMLEYLKSAREADDYFGVVGIFCTYCNKVGIKWNLPMFHSYEGDKGSKFYVTDQELERFKKHFDIFVKLSAIDDEVAEKIHLEELNQYELYG